MSQVVLDAVGRRRSPATMPGFHAGRPPRNKGQRYPADPPTVAEIVTVMGAAGDSAHGRRLRALIVVLSRAGLRIHEALALTGVRSRRASRRAAGSAWQGRAPARSRAACRSGRCSASSPARRGGERGQAQPSARSFAAWPSDPAYAGALRPTSSAIPMPSRWLARASP